MKQSRRTSVYWKILAPLLFLVGGLSLYLYLIWLPAAIADRIDYSRTQIQRNLESLSEAMLPSLLEGQLSNLYETLDALKKRNPDWKQVTLSNEHGISLYPLIEKPLLKESKSVKIFNKPIRFEGRLVATLQVAIDFKDLIRKARSESFKVFLALIIVVLLFSSYTTYVLRRNINRPIKQLVSAIDSMASGDLYTPVQLDSKSSAEFERIYRRFRTMRSSIRKSRRLLENSNQTLKKEKAKSEAANMAKTQFLSNMSHEIRTPLNGILGMMQLLKKEPLEPEQHELVRLSTQSGELLLSIISDILEISKIESGKMEVEKRNFDLVQSLNTTLEVLELSAQEKGLAFPVKLSSDLPRTYFGDETRVNQVLLNLIGNAIKFTSSGEVSVTVKRLDSPIELKGPEQSLLFCVKDSGIGIPDTRIDKIFEPFLQADISDTRKFGGSGLGLTISKEIVEALGGKIWLTSEEGVGSEFSFELPIESTVSQELPAEGRKTASSAPEKTTMIQENLSSQSNPPNSSPRALVVEDNKINQMVATATLKSKGWESQVAENGEEAVEIWKTGRFDLILMDCQMPVKDGFEATRDIRELEKQTPETPPTPIVAMTANVFKKTKQQCLYEGMDDFISKPFTEDQLDSVLKKYQKAG